MKTETKFVLDFLKLYCDLYKPTKVILDGWDYYRVGSSECSNARFVFGDDGCPLPVSIRMEYPGHIPYTCILRALWDLDGHLPGLESRPRDSEVLEALGMDDVYERLCNVT